MNETKLNIIADFLNGKLSATEKDEFLTQIEADIELKAEFEKLQQLKAIAERNRILEEVRQVHEQKIAALKASKGRIISLPKISGVAAAACFVGVFYLGNADFDYLELSSAERGNNNALTALTDLERGLSLLKTDEPKTAIQYFRKAKDNTELTDYYRDAARWYEVVSYAEMDMDENAKSSLNLIENSKSFKYKIGGIEEWKMKIRLTF
jgi:hypothetical protein